MNGLEIVKIPYLPLFRKLASGRATDEERAFYMKRYAGAMEKKLGKPYFEFTDEEELDYKIAEENAKEGNLDLTDGTHYYCAECKNRGYIADKQNGAYIERDCKCAQIRRAMIKAKLSGLGDVFGKFTFNGFKTDSQWKALMKDKALEFLKSRSNCFFVGGTSGCGKSHICTAIAGYFLKQVKDVEYVQWVDFLDELNNVRFRNVDRYYGLLNRAKNAEVLYIDDLLKTDNSVKSSAADIKTCYQIINARYTLSRTAGKKRYVTIISSEHSLNKICAFDMATGGRIKELAGDFVLRIEGEDKNQRISFGG